MADGPEHPRYETLELFIGARWGGSGDGRTMDVVNPATEAVIGALPVATSANLDATVQSAKQGFAIWRDTPEAERARVLSTAAQLMRAEVEHLATVMTLEQGKPLYESRLEVDATAGQLD